MLSSWKTCGFGNHLEEPDMCRTHALELARRVRSAGVLWGAIDLSFLSVNEVATTPSYSG